MAHDTARTVLVADDEPDVHAFVQAALEEDGYAFLTAHDGEQALALARSESPDLVILDVQMPRKTGFTVFQELRADAATRGIPVIMLTAVSQRVGLPFGGDDMGELYGSDPEAFIDKPVDPDALRDAVRRLLAAGPPS
jgi:two-component system alkaline phosphatase synthesis response regulator PhoP